MDGWPEAEAALKRKMGDEGKGRGKTYLRDIALLNDKVAYVKWAITAKHEFLKSSTRVRVDKAVFG